MQIHELNNYSGNLDSNAYIAVDNGSDTGKVSTDTLLADTNSEISQLDQTLNARIDNIIAGGTAPSVSEIVDARLGAADLGNVQYDSLGAAIRGQADSLYEEITSLREFDNHIANIGYQYLKEAEKTTGKIYYVSGNKVVVGDGNNSAVYEPVRLQKGVTYYYQNLYAYFCFIDQNGTITRLSENTANFVNGSFTPSDDVIFYPSINTGASVNRSLRTTRFYPKAGTEGFYSIGLSVDGYTHISVKADGTGDYTNPVSAVRDIKDSSENKQYMLDIYEGTYNIWTMLNAEEKQGSIWGLTLPDYVHMRGIGNRDNIILACINDTPGSTAEVEYTSCLNLKQNNNLENLTFTARNARYVVHDESSNTNKDWKRIVKNCRFVHYGNDAGYWAYTDAWGEGCSSGSYSYFENCIFENNSYVPPFKFHTNTDFEAGCTHIFKECEFIQHYNGADSSGAFGIVDIQSGKPINVEFIGCTFSSFIFVENYNSATDIEELNITGHGNNPVFVYPYRPNVSSPKRIFAKFTDMVMLVYNPYGAIEKGKPLRWADYTRNRVAVAQSNGSQCCGIAVDDIPANSWGYMQFSGILNTYQLGVTGITMGARIGVNNYALAEVTDGSYFARAVQNDVIMFC